MINDFGVINWDRPKKPVDPKKYEFPELIRCCMVGPTNCGKTNALFTVIFKLISKKLIERLYLFTKTPQQEKLQTFINEVLEAFKEDVDEEDFNFDYSIHTEISEIPTNDELEKQNSKICFIFDDFLLEPDQTRICELFTLGRHVGVTSLFYLSQKWSSIKKIMRENANVVMVWKLALPSDIRRLYNDVNVEVTFEQFNKLLHKCTNKKNGFLFIDLYTDIPEKKLRYGLTKKILNLD